MRISDWSSDVCSSDLGAQALGYSRPCARLLRWQRQSCRRPSLRIARQYRDIAWLRRLILGLIVEFRQRLLQLADPQSVHRSSHNRSEEHTSELQSLMRISYAVFCLKKKKQKKNSI